MLGVKVSENVAEKGASIWKKVTAPFIQMFGLFLFSLGGGLTIYATTWDVPFLVHILGIMTGIVILAIGQVMAPSSRHS